MTTLQSVVKADQIYCVTQKERPLSEDEKPEIMSKEEQGEDKYASIWKRVEGNTIAVDVGARAQEFREKPPEKEVILIGRKVYGP